MACTLRIGLTGGLGSGKSTVARLFAAHGVPVVDADEIAHRLTRPEAPAVQPIIAAFGNEVTTADGGIDRKRLAARVFGDPGQRRQLETILHPLIRAEMEREAHMLDAPYCLFVIPLLVEAGQRGLVDRALVVDTEERLQIERARARDGRSESQVRAILAAQASREQRLAIADDIIRNDGDHAALEQQVEALHHDYLALASSTRRGR